VLLDLPDVAAVDDVEPAVEQLVDRRFGLGAAALVDLVQELGLNLLGLSARGLRRHGLP
jgi:hypothetical protein